MPEQLSVVTVAACAVLAGAVLGGTYALAHDGPPAPAPAPASPVTLRLEHDPIGALRHVSPLPALIVPPPRPKPAEPTPAVVDSPPVIPASTPAPPAPPAATPTPPSTPRPHPPAKKPLTFDDSG